MDEAREKRWRELSEEVLSGMKEWRLAHPRATFREIEQAVQERLHQLEIQLVQDVALGSSQRDWHPLAAASPRCPVCETPLQKRGKQTRRLQGRGGNKIRLERSYGTCPVCGAGVLATWYIHSKN